MGHRSWRVRTSGILVALGLACGAFASSAALASAGTVTCPTVDPMTGALSIFPEPGIDWSGCDLEGADLTSAPLSKADLTSANLTSANLTSADVDSVNFTDADLANATVAKADLDFADLTGATMTSTDFSGAFLNSADITGGDVGNAVLGTTSLTNITSGGLTGGFPASLPAKWTEINGTLLGPTAIMKNADLSGVDLSGLDLSGGSLAGADLDNANLAKADLLGDSLANASLANTNFSGTNLGGVDLTNDDLSSAVLTEASSGAVTGSPVLPVNWALAEPSGYLLGPDADLTGARMDNASIAGADLAHADLSDAQLLNANVSFANLTGADLAGAEFENASIFTADLTGADAQHTDLSFANMDNADFTNANLTGADLDSGIEAGAIWSDTTCPDGSDSDKHAPAGCTTPLDTAPPVAMPKVASGKAGTNGWFTSPVRVSWNWTDDGVIDQAKCTKSSSTPGNGRSTLSASCSDLAGNTGSASFQVKVDTTRPVVAVTRVQAKAIYIDGGVPAAGCQASDPVSGVAQQAAVTTRTSGKDGVGKFTATCAGAVSRAGTKQAAPVSVSYQVVFGFGGFSAPKAGTTVRKSARSVAARFRLATASGKPIAASVAASLASARKVRVTLSGPRISAVTTNCAWQARPGVFQCTVSIPAAVRTGKTSKYLLTATANLGAGFAVVPVVGKAANPETIHFK